MTAIEIYNWGFSYLCPACRTWTAYHAPRVIPERMSTRRRGRWGPADKLLLEFHCEDCNEALTITMDLD